MSKYFIPGLLFGCGAFPVATSVTGQPVAEEATLRNSVFTDPAVKISDQSFCLDVPVRSPTGWSKAFTYWSSKSRDAMIEAINSPNRERAELHEARALANVRKALNEIAEHGRTKPENS